MKLLALDQQSPNDVPNLDDIPPSPTPPLQSPVDPQWELKDSDIRVKYHPHANVADKMYRFEDYLASIEAAYDRMDTDQPDDEEPWRPFRTILDFEIAELVQETNMTRGQKSSLLRLVRRCIADPEQFTLIDEPDLQKTWDSARRAHMSSVRHLHRYCIR